MLLSLFKKISGSSEPAKPTTPAPRKDEIVKESKHPVNLPCWKDKSSWSNSGLSAQEESDCKEIKETITDLLMRIRDPEKPNTLEDLSVITEESVQVQPLKDGGYYVRIDFFPTVPHCSLASLIGLCLRGKIHESLAERVKLDIVIAEGRHSTEEEINKQINDKERVAAAMENPNLKEIVQNCIKDEE